MLNTNQARINMVMQQIRPWNVLDQSLLNVLAKCPRELFVPEAYEEVAFADVEIPLGFNQVMLPPSIIGRMLSELKIMNTESVLEIGTGSGYLTALLSELAKTVTSTEIHRTLANIAIKKLSSLHISNVEVLHGNAHKILHSSKSFDVVILTGSVTNIPKQITNQTKFGGRLFAVTGNKAPMQACIFTRINEGTWSKERLFETVIPRLEGIDDSEAFDF